MEYWSIGVLEYWSIGVLEYWSARHRPSSRDCVSSQIFARSPRGASITPSLQYSITPLLHYSCTPVLLYSCTPDLAPSWHLPAGVAQLPIGLSVIR
jgi:hypothetical protein